LFEREGMKKMNDHRAFLYIFSKNKKKEEKPLKYPVGL